MSIRTIRRNRLIVVAGLVVALAAAFLATSVVPSRGQSPGVAPGRQSAGKTLCVVTDQYTNYGVEPRSWLPEQVRQSQQRTRTESWLQLDDSGSVVEYRNITRGAGGDLYQDQRYREGVELVNWYGWLQTGADCTERIVHRLHGGAVPRVTEADLIRGGFSRMEADAAERLFGRPLGAHVIALESPDQRGVAYFQVARRIVLVDSSTGYDAGSALIAVTEDGDLLWSPSSGR